jgi:ribose 5-phosphate isomerase A
LIALHAHSVFDPLLSNPEGQMSRQDEFKAAAAHAAAALLHDGMVVGLGSGTTATMAVAAIGRRVAQGLQIIGVSTSEQTSDQARSLHIPLATLEERSVIDVTIDGADEVETGTLHLIKGGGGNLLREKIVAVASARMIVVADESKVVGKLGSRFPIPVEVVPFGWKTTSNRLQNVNANPKLRRRPDGQTFITDGGNYILDCAHGPIEDPAALQREFDSIVGVVEHGLFIGIASEALVAGPDGVRTLIRTI